MRSNFELADDSLSDRDLLACLVGDVEACLLLTRCGGSLLRAFALADPTIPHLPALACDFESNEQTRLTLQRLRASHLLVRRMLRQQMQPGSLLADPAAVKTYLRATVATLQHEVFIVLTLDAKMNLIAATEMFRGTLTQTSVYPREVVRLALCQSAAAVILAHNHPSGLLEPSRADECLTQTLKQSLALVDVRVADHLIVNAHGCLSFAERGLL